LIGILNAGRCGKYESPGNDDLGPDFLMMAKRIEPRVLAEIPLHLGARPELA
jgi:hypothetical protein